MDYFTIKMFIYMNCPYNISKKSDSNVLSIKRMLRQKLYHNVVQRTRTLAKKMVKSNDLKC